jgi:hypothetical protein
MTMTFRNRRVYEAELRKTLEEFIGFTITDAQVWRIGCILQEKRRVVTVDLLGSDRQHDVTRYESYDDYLENPQ